MARKDKPYLALYVQDFMTDERLMECSAAATGVYIRIMCMMHKSETYGTILLKQKDKQSDKQIENFALKVAKHLPYELVVIESAISELLTENVLRIDGDSLVQKRMFEDGQLSQTRSDSGTLGGQKTQENIKNFALAKTQANSDIDNDIENILLLIRESATSVEGADPKIFVMIVLKMIEVFKKYFPKYPVNKEFDYPACLQIAYKIAELKGWKRAQVVDGKMKDCLNSWTSIVEFASKDDWLCTRSIYDIGSDKEWPRIVQKMSKSKKQPEKKSDAPPLENLREIKP